MIYYPIIFVLLELSLSKVYNQQQSMVKVYYSYAFSQAVGFASSRNANFAIDHHSTSPSPRKTHHHRLQPVPPPPLTQNRRTPRHPPQTRQPHSYQTHPPLLLPHLHLLWQRSHRRLGPRQTITTLHPRTTRLNRLLALLQRRLDSTCIRRVRWPSHPLGFALRRTHNYVSPFLLSKSAHNNAITQV